MSDPEKGRITELLNSVRKGNRQDEDELISAIYGQLRKLAQQQMRQERPGHTLQATALVHEAYLKLIGRQSIEWQNRQQFMAIAAREMRHTLIDYARQAKAGKRGGSMPRVSVEDIVGAHPGAAPVDVEALDLNRLLGDLERLQPETAEVVVLKFFGGLTDPEVASEMDISFAKVRRHWVFARAWFLKELQPKI